MNYSIFSRFLFFRPRNIPKYLPKDRTRLTVTFPGVPKIERQARINKFRFWVTEMTLLFSILLRCRKEIYFSGCDTTFDDGEQFNKRLLTVTSFFGIKTVFAVASSFNSIQTSFVLSSEISVSLLGKLSFFSI